MKKWTITLLPKKFSNDHQKTVTETHEEGHRKIDQGAVDAVNAATTPANKGKMDTSQKVTDLLIAYENAGNKKYHEVFGHSPKTTEVELKKVGGDVKKLQEAAVKEGKEAGQKALDDKLK